jgi:hypothetical protein
LPYEKPLESASSEEDKLSLESHAITTVGCQMGRCQALEEMLTSATLTDLMKISRFQNLYSDDRSLDPSGKLG